MGSDRNSNSSILHVENQMKNEGAKVVITLYSYFRRSRAASSVAGVGCGRKSNSFNLLWVSLIPARMRKIHSEMKVLEWSQHISHCKSMQIFYDAQGKLTTQSEVGSTQTHPSFYGCPCYLQE